MLDDLVQTSNKMSDVTSKSKTSVSAVLMNVDVIPKSANSGCMDAFDRCPHKTV